MNALELADFYEPQSSQVAAMLRAQHEAIRVLRETLKQIAHYVGDSNPPSNIAVRVKAALAAT